MWEPRRLTNLRAFTATYRDSFTLPFFLPYTCIKKWEYKTKILLVVVDGGGGVGVGGDGGDDDEDEVKEEEDG
jgi:hypothetical protein